MGKGETRGGDDETVESVSKDSPAGEILILPKLIKQRVVEPVFITGTV